MARDLLERARSAMEAGQQAEDASALDVAAHCVDDAVRGRNTDFSTGKRELSLYRAYKRPWMTGAMYAAYVGYLALALFERPAQPSLQLPFWVTVTAEFAFVCAFLCRLFHEMLFSAGGPVSFWRDHKHVAQAVMLALILVDIVAYTVLAESGHPSAVRWSRPLRPLLAVNLPESRQVRAGFRNIRRTLPEVASVLFLLLASISLFSLMAFKLFGGPVKSADVGGPFFVSFGESVWSMYVLLTTANHPNVMMPALSHSRWCALFFVLYLVVNLYMFMSVFLAVVYNRFRANLKNEVRESLDRGERLLDRAFDHASACDVADPDGGRARRGVDRGTFLELCQRADCLRRRPPHYVDALWLVLDPTGRGAVSRREFGDLAELLKMPYSDLTPSQNIFERFIPTIYNSKVTYQIATSVPGL